MRPLRTAAMLASLLVIPSVAVGQWADDAAALRTPGPVVRSGNQLRVELIAFDPLYGPFTAQVTYRYQGRILVEKEKGGQHETTRLRTVTRPPTPVIDELAAGQVMVLDDTFFLGDDSSAGRYDVEVAIEGVGGYHLKTLRTCVEHQPDATASGAPHSGTTTVEGCGFAITGVQRSEGEGWLDLHGRFPDTGIYRALILDRHVVVGRVDSGISTITATSLLLASPLLTALSGRTVDVVLHDVRTNSSATLSRLTLSKIR